MMSLLDIVGTLGSGWLSDRYDKRLLLAGYYGLRGLSLLFLSGSKRVREARHPQRPFVRHDPIASQADAPMYTPGETCAAHQKHNRREIPYEMTQTGLLLVDSPNDVLASEGTLIVV